MESKYQLLAEKFVENNIPVETINYNDADSEKLFSQLLDFKAILVWINPVEKDMNRQILDNLLLKLSDEKIYVSAHPSTILKIGTKDILYQTKNMSWSTDANIFKSFQDFETGFIKSLNNYSSRIIKPYRGNGGKGICRVSIAENNNNEFLVQYAEKGISQEKININTFLNRYKVFFSSGNHFIDQEWCNQITNGMVRCYLTLDRVVGFGYQEINALYPVTSASAFTKLQPGKRYYFTESCGLFSDLKLKMENEWVPQLMLQFNLSPSEMPVIWDADFFIDINSVNKKYLLCEINASSVSPFPDSATMPIIETIKTIIN